MGTVILRQFYSIEHCLLKRDWNSRTKKTIKERFGVLKDKVQKKKKKKEKKRKCNFLTKKKKKKKKSEGAFLSPKKKLPRSEMSADLLPHFPPFLKNGTNG